MKILFICVAFVAIAAVSAKRQRCFPVGDVTAAPAQCAKAHTHYEQCGTACPRNCDNYAQESIPCTKNCVRGCFCDKGYVVAGDECIAISECPVKPVCPANEEYSKCGANGCQNTCANPTLGQVCKAMCIEGCVCAEGYLRNSEGGCTLAENCPAVTPTCALAYEEYTSCGTACPKTCKNYKEQMMCTMQCVEGCFCQSGYVRDDAGNCVTEAECPVAQVCNATHEVYSDCGAYCQPTCGPATACAAPPQECNPGCVCEEGYVRKTHGGECVKQEECPQECKEFEEYSLCGANSCQKACSLIGGNFPCRPICTAGCICIEGYIKDYDGFCIKKEDCKGPGQNEVYSECGANECQNTCYNPSLGQVCRGTCVEGYVCAEGYYRDSRSDCVLFDDCPAAPLPEIP